MLYRLLITLLGLSVSILQADVTPPISTQEVAKVNPYHTPLNNLSSFAVLPISDSTPLQAQFQNKIHQLLKNELGKIGEIHELNINNSAGFALSLIFLAINIQNITILGEETPSLTKVSLSIETMTTIKQSNTECLSRIWERSVFTEDASDKNIIAAVQKLAQQFTTCYQACNAKEPKKPTFYLYKS
jgi:hypothetical protein